MTTVYIYDPLVASGSSSGSTPPPPPTAEEGLTFDLCPEFDVRTVYRRRGSKSPSSGGFVQRRTHWRGFNLRTFYLTWSYGTAAEVTRLRDLWARAYGPVKTMTYTPPDGSATLVRFKGGSLSLRQRTPLHWRIDLALEEVR